MSKYKGLGLNWDNIYLLSSEATSLLLSKVSTQAEIFLIASIMATMANANLENIITLQNWNDKERSTFWNNIEMELQKHEAIIRETMNDRKAKISGSIEDSLGKQLRDKNKELRVIVARCGFDEKDVRDDIADSMEGANNLTKFWDSIEDSYRWWADWWYRFMREWVSRCFVKYVDKSRTLYPHILYSDNQGRRDLWLSKFEPLWVVGCDIARLIQMNGITSVMTQFIPNRTHSYDENKQQKIWNWVNGFNEIALGVFDLFKQKERKVFDSTLEWSKGHSKDLISAELRRLLSN